MLHYHAQLILTAFGIGLSGALMPGPLLSVVVAHSASGGFRPGYSAAVGHVALELLVVLSFSLGLQRLLSLAGAGAVPAFAGSAVLAWMGISMILRAPAAMTDANGQDRNGNRGPFADGIIASLANPYWLLWWATVGTGQASVSLAAGFLGLLSFYVGHASADLVWYAAVAGAVSRGRKLLAGSRYAALVRCCGAFLVVMSACFLWAGVRSLSGP